MDCIPYINDLMVEIDMLKELKKSETNKSKIENMDKLIKSKMILISECKDSINRLSNYQICYKIYLNLLSGLRPTKAVEKVADENYYNDIKPSSVSKIWDYYKKMKKLLNRE